MWCLLSDWLRWPWTDESEPSAEKTMHESSTKEQNVQNSHFLKTLKISNDIREYSLMVILPVGIVLNFLTIVTFLKIKMHKTSTGLHLVFLAISEFLLLVAFTFYWGRLYKFNYTNSVHCFLETVALSSPQTWSGFLMASTTVERFIAVAFPMKVKMWNLKIISKASIFCSALVSLVLGGLSASTKLLEKSENHNTCATNAKFEDLNKVTNTVTYTILGFGMCPLLTLFFTVLIVFKLYRNKLGQLWPKKHKQLLETKSSESHWCLFLWLLCSSFLRSL